MQVNLSNVWRKTWGDSRPEPRTPIILLTEDARVMRGYMAVSTWAGEVKVTYSFHGEYYDFKKSKLTYCLVNALAWMPLPDVPQIHTHFEALRLQELQGDGKSYED